MKKRLNFDAFSIAAIIILPVLLYANVLFTGKMLFGTDWVAGEYMQRDFFVRFLHSQKTFALWNPLKFAGIPTGEGFFGDIFYPITLLLKIFLPLFTVWTLEFIIHPIIAGIGTFLFAKAKTENSRASLFAAISYMFTGVLISEVYGGHDGRVIVMSYLPLLIYFLDRGLFTERLYNFLFASVAAGFMLLSGHIQSSYYAVLFGVFYVVYAFIENNFSHRMKNASWIAGLIIGYAVSFFNKYIGFALFITAVFAIPPVLDKKMPGKVFKIYGYLVLFVIFAAAISAVQYLPVMRFLPEAARGTVRDYAYATSWSMGIPDIFDLFINGFSGINFQDTNTYWGENPFKLHTGYMGLMPILFAIGGMLSKKRDTYVKFFTIASFSVIVLALGKNTPLYRIFHSLFIYVDKFRAPELIFFLFSFSASILSAKFLSGNENRKTFEIVLLLYAAFGLIILLFPSAVTSIFRQTVANYPSNAQYKMNAMSNAISGLKGTVIVNFIMILLAYTALFFTNAKYRNAVVIGLTLLTLLDLWTKVAKFIVPVENPKAYYAQDEVVSFLKSDNDLYRVLPFSYRNDDYLNIFDIQTVSGNHPSPFYEYQNFINNPSSVMFNPMSLSDFPNRLRLLNVKYVVAPFIPADTSGYDAKSKQIIGYYNNLFDRMGFKRVSAGDKYMILETEKFIPRFFVAYDYIVCDSLSSALKAIDSDSVDLMKTVILYETPNIPLKTEKEPDYGIDSISYSPNAVRISLSTSSDGFLVFLDQYYKAWRCRINGRETEILKADGIFRSVRLDKGKADVVFFYDSNLQKASALISLLAITLIFAVFLTEKIMHRSKGVKSD